MYIGVEQRIFIPERHRLTHSLQRRLVAHGGTQRAMELQRLTGAQQFDGARHSESRSKKTVQHR